MNAANCSIPNAIAFDVSSHLPQIRFTLYLTGHGYKEGAGFANNEILPWTALFDKLLEWAYKLVEDNKRDNE